MRANEAAEVLSTRFKMLVILVLFSLPVIIHAWSRNLDDRLRREAQGVTGWSPAMMQWAQRQQQVSPQPDCPASERVSADDPDDVP